MGNSASPGQTLAQPVPAPRDALAQLPANRAFTELTVSSPGQPSDASPSPLTVQQQQQQATSKVPGEKRDSKVIKAAQYWNNFIGEVMVKNRPPENPKNKEKPRKITSAGVGQKGYNELITAFEKKTMSDSGASSGGSNTPSTNGDGSGKGSSSFQRRNSKKITLEGCQPGLRVTDAKNVFEMKNQPSTPQIYRRNSATSGSEPSEPSKQWAPPAATPPKDQDGVKSPSPMKMAKESSKLSHPATTEKDSSAKKSISNGVSIKDPTTVVNGQKESNASVKSEKKTESGVKKENTKQAKPLKTEASTEILEEAPLKKAAAALITGEINREMKREAGTAKQETPQVPPKSSGAQQSKLTYPGLLYWINS